MEKSFTWSPLRQLLPSFLVSKGFYISQVTVHDSLCWCPVGMKKRLTTCPSHIVPPELAQFQFHSQFLTVDSIPELCFHPLPEVSSSLFGSTVPPRDQLCGKWSVPLLTLGEAGWELLKSVACCGTENTINLFFIQLPTEIPHFPVVVREAFTVLKETNRKAKDQKPN